jgi:hypothetical protein
MFFPHSRMVNDIFVFLTLTTPAFVGIF